MKILLIGGGGREHALAWALVRDPACTALYCAPGNAGTAALGHNVAIPAEDIDGLLKWAQAERPDLTVVGPEAPLCGGLVDRFQHAGLRVFGPSQAAAQLEGSKRFTKDVLQAAGVPTARAESFTEASQALAYVQSVALPVVVKADGLAAGKGVTLCHERAQAVDAVNQAMVQQAFGEAGRQVLIEDFLEGEEVSVLAWVDGDRALLLPTAQDHKRVFDGDQGPNTGGMGAYSPAPMETPAFMAEIQRLVFDPTLRELKRRNIRYQGVLYAGMMLTASGPKVLEFNCRFGDPETQVIVPRLTGSLVESMQACIDGRLTSAAVACRREHAVCVVMTAGGYPGAYRKGDRIEGLKVAATLPDVHVFQAGTRLQNSDVLTAGGRVLGVTALGPTLAEAAGRAYEAVSRLSFSEAHFRKDIAARGLKRRAQT